MTGHRRATSSLLALVLLLPALVAAVGAPIDALPPGIGIRLQDVPVDRADDPRANDYVVDHTIPGGVVRRTLLVTNGTDGELPVTMRGVAADAAEEWLVEDGGVAPGPGDLAAWITVEPATFVLAPQSGLEVEVTIAVPSDTPPGERYAVVVAEPPPVDAGNGIGMISRVGTRVYLSVGGDEPVTEFAVDTLTASRTADGAPSLDVAVTNTGGRAIDVTGEVALESEDGLVSAGPFRTAIAGTLGPGNRGAVTVPLPADLAPGPWVATATMRSGTLERAARATVTFPGTPGDVADPVEVERIERQRRTLIPIAAALLVLALGVLGGLTWLGAGAAGGRGARGRTEAPNDDDAPAVAAASSGEHPR